MSTGLVMTWSEGDSVKMFNAINPPDDRQLWYLVTDDIFVSVYAAYAMTADGKQ